MAKAATVRTLDIPTKLSIEFSCLSAEYTWMAWVRTGTCLIAFGFLIYKFFQQFDRGEAVVSAGSFFGAYEIALIMIGAGLGSVLGATVQHRASLKKIGDSFVDVPHWLLPVAALLISLLGILALLAVILQK
ncbi:MAG TPA: DUF202 domain-containing protein [Candidatus Binatia bacterium]|jgi:putative membrane protein